MKTEKKILIAFILNISFAIFEILGGFLTNSVAIFSDAIHDLGDAITIGISYYLEKKSQKKPDGYHTYGYVRYSVLGAAITSIILLVGSGIAISHAIDRIINPANIYFNGMLAVAIVGVVINFVAACFTHGGDSLNQKAVNLHMLEDVLGWIVVLVGAIVIKITNWTIIDPIMSIGLAIYIAYHAVLNLKEIVFILAETVDDEFLVRDVEKWLYYAGNVQDVHHLHIWKLDENKMCASVHIKTSQPTLTTKKQIRHVFQKYGIEHVTIEFETPDENCTDTQCSIYAKKTKPSTCCHSHHYGPKNCGHGKQNIPKLDIEF